MKVSAGAIDCSAHHNMTEYRIARPPGFSTAAAAAEPRSCYSGTVAHIYSATITVSTQQLLTVRLGQPPTYLCVIVSVPD